MVTAPATYRSVITHARRAPVSNRFRYRTRMWLVDLDDLPQLPRGLRWSASFCARDHLGAAGDSLRANLDRFLATQDIDLAGGRILMLANARSLGHVFNPISLYWCYADDDALVAVVAEVHNTYGDRHAYLLRPGTTTDGYVDTRVDKQMYVSPFNDAGGRYRISVTPPAGILVATVTLERNGAPPFGATLEATRERQRGTRLVALLTAPTSMRVSFLIRWQGVRLFLRGLRVEPRPAHPAQEAV